MRRCNKASIRENLLFQRRYCVTPEAREQLAEKFKVTVEAYEELPPWYSTFNADGSDIRLKDDIIMFRVCDVTNCIEYYPVFPASEGLRLLRKWKMEIPPKMTAFAYDYSQEIPSKDNACLRSLIAFSRLFMLDKGKQHSKMPYGFNNLYQQLHYASYCEVAAEPVRLVNAVLGEYIASTHTLHYGDSRTFREFIAYLNHSFSLLKFKDSNFDRLRDKLKEAYPDEEIYF